MGGGGTSSNPIIPPEFAPLINASVQNMVNQQGNPATGQAGLNPITSYNASNPMGVQGLTPAQQMAMQQTMGATQQSPLNSLALQAAQRAAGMAGQGPTTGMYDSSGEMGLQDWAQLMNPYLGKGGDMGNQLQPQAPLTAAQGANQDPSQTPQTNFSGGAPNMSQPPPGYAGPGGGQGGQGGGQSVSPQPGQQAGQGSGAWGSGAQFYKDPMGQWRVAETGNAGNTAGTGLHGMGGFNSQGQLQQYYYAGDQGQATTPGQAAAHGMMSVRPTDPAGAAAWDKIQAGTGAATGTQAAGGGGQSMSLQDAMKDPSAASYIQAHNNIGRDMSNLQNQVGWAQAAANRNAQANDTTPETHNTAISGHLNSQGTGGVTPSPMKQVSKSVQAKP